MAKRIDEEDNHWPGFVDALSTIVMVVTFLLIVLGIVIFAISLQISQTVIVAKISGKPPSEINNTETLEKVESKKIASEAKTEDAKKIEKKEEKSEETQTSESQSSQAKTKQTVGVASGEKGEEVIQEEAVEADNNLQIQSRKVIGEKKIIVASQEEADKAKEEKVAVNSAQQILTITFEKLGLEVTEVAKTEISGFMTENKAALEGRKLTAWAFYDANSTAQSQAKRQAYFRLLAVRNVLIANGWKGSDLEVNVRPAPSGEEKSQVRVFAR